MESPKRPHMQIQLTNIDELKPYDGNPRVNDQAVDAVARSIRDFGWRVPVVVDKDNTVICGHTRLKAARSIGISKIPVHVAGDLTPAQVRGLRLADNATGAIATWDEELLPSPLVPFSPSHGRPSKVARWNAVHRSVDAALSTRRDNAFGRRLGPLGA